MARRKTSNVRQALVLAFAVGTLAGAAGTLTLRRRGRRDAGSAGDTAGFRDDISTAALDGRFDNPPPTPAGAPVAAKQG